LTLHGNLEIRRTVLYSKTDGEMIIPFDEYVEISGLPYKITKQMMLKIAYYAQNQASFEATSKLFREEFGIDISGKQIEKVAEYVGKKTFEKDTEISKNIIENMHNEIPQIEGQYRRGITLYLMTDGALVNTLLQDEKGSTYREAKTVMAFTSKDIIKRKDGSKIILKKEYASFIGSAEDFKKYVLNVAVKSGYGQINDVVILGDGASWIRTMCNEIFPDATQILDFYHLKENAYSYAKSLYGDDKDAYTMWAERFMDKIVSEKTEEALAMIPSTQNALPSGTVNLKTYIENNKDKIKYKYYQSKGYYIGSGPIESANKIIVQRRLKQSGMRWSLDGAQYMLTLRSKVESNRWYEVEDILCA